MIVESGSVRISIAASFSSSSSRSPTIELVRDVRRPPSSRSPPSTCSRRRRWSDGLADEVEERSIFSRRDANRAPFSDGGDDVDCVRDLARECRRLDGRAVGGACTSRAELLEQTGRRLAVAGDVPA